MSSAPNTLALFSSYFPQADVPSYVLTYLKRLLPHTQKLVLVTQIERLLSPAAKRDLDALNCEIMYVPNQGMDFGMWSKALEKYWDQEQYSSLILANDSCISMRPLCTFFERASTSPIDCIGMTDSYNKAYHLQSYFLYAANNHSARAVASYITSKTNFLASNPRYADVVKECEIGLSQHLISSGLSLKALWESDPADPPVDPTYVYAGLNVQHGMPLLKKKFLQGISPRALKILAYNGLTTSPRATYDDLVESHDCVPGPCKEIERFLLTGDRNLSKRLFQIFLYKIFRRIGLKRKRYLLRSKKIDHLKEMRG